MCDKEKFELDRNEDPMSYSTGMPLDWRFGGANLVPLMGSSACSSASVVVDSYGPNFWDHFSSSQNLGFVDFNVHNNGNSSNTNGIRKDGFGFASVGHDDHRTLEMGSNPINSMFKGDAFLLPNGEGMLFPQSPSQFQTDSGFIEKAARFSCFSTGNFGDMVNSHGIPQSIGVFPRNGGTKRGKGDAQGSDVNVIEAEKDVPRSVEHLASKESPLKIDKRSDNHVNVTSQDEGKQILGGSVNNSDRAESSGDDNTGGQDDLPRLKDTSEDPSIQGLNSKKRKRSGQDDDDDKVSGDPELPSGAAKDNSESQQKAEQQPFSTPKASGKNAKQGPQASDPQPKDEYIHVRARRGQATNSHSLAERLRREKISERMKFLQDLVPGCSKVTGKAVMLDEIINYVQSLQRQVEFLSMKLATINPRMDLNIEGLLAKDILQQSALGFPPEMPMAFTPTHPSQPGLIRSTLPSMANSLDILRRTIHPQLSPLNGGFKEPNQLPELWEDGLHNVVQMNFATTAPLSSQDLDGTQLLASQMKGEL